MTKRTLTILIATVAAVGFVVAVIAGSLGPSSEMHVMPNGQTMTGGSMTAR